MSEEGLWPPGARLKKGVAVGRGSAPTVPPPPRRLTYTDDRHIPTAKERYRYLRHELQRMLTLHRSVSEQIIDIQNEMAKMRKARYEERPDSN